MLIDTNHRATDERPTVRQRHHAASDPATPQTILERGPSLHSAPPSGCLPEPQIAAAAHPYRPHGWSSKTAAHSWFSTNRIAAPNPDLPRLYSPAAVQSTTICSNQGATGQQSRRIQVYPDSAQKVTITTWLTASRWTYNLTVEILQSGIPAVWKHIASMVMPEVKALHPEWDSVPYQVKRTAVRDACRAMSNVKTFNMELKDSQTHGQQSRRRVRPTRLPQSPEPQAILLHTGRRRDGARRLSHHSGTAADGRSHPGGAQRMPTGEGARPILARRSAYPAQCDIETPSGDGVVALDPGVRTFLTYFSETDCGKLGHHAFGRIQRLCHWLDDLISRTAKAPNRRKRRQMRSAQARMRQRITNLVDELHWQLARWLTSNYRIILLPTFETHDLTQRAGRKIRSKTARMMLTFRHYEFKQRLQWKAWQRGALVLDVDEAYTSKTRSWDGTVNTKLGGAKVIRDETGFGMDRDVNGARGIFLRALGDSPFLRGLLTQVASQTTASA